MLDPLRAPRWCCSRARTFRRRARKVVPQSELYAEHAARVRRARGTVDVRQHLRERLARDVPHALEGRDGELANLTCNQHQSRGRVRFRGRHS